MGFQIRINESSERMLKTLKTLPEEIFQERYHCYFLFLVGASDDEAMEWLIKNVVAPDSLTGKEIAFGIFMKSFKIPLHVSSETITKQPKIAATIPTDKLKGHLYSTERIIKNHIHEHVYTGDEIMAITYATDIVAKDFKVMDRLPCVLLLDPLPFGNIQVIQLSNTVCNHLIKFLRHSIHKYLNEIGDKPNAFSYTSAILDAQKSMDNWEYQRENYLRRIEKLTNDLGRLKGERSSETGLDYIKEKLNTARVNIEKGAARKIRIALFGDSFRSHNPYKYGLNFDEKTKESILNFLEKECLVIHSCDVTIAALNSYLDRDETADEWKQRVSFIYSNYIVTLLGFQLPSDVDHNKKEVTIWIHQLKKKKVELISIFLKLLPDIKTIEKNIYEDFQKNNSALITTLQIELDNIELEYENYKKNYLFEKNRLETLLDDSIRQYQKNDPITFSSIFVKEIKAMKMDGYLSQTKIAGGKFAENLFKPDTIMKILDLINKMTG